MSGMKRSAATYPLIPNAPNGGAALWHGTPDE
jgi:hypothetical protein